MHTTACLETLLFWIAAPAAVIGTPSHSLDTRDSATQTIIFMNPTSRVGQMVCL